MIFPVGVLVLALLCSATGRVQEKDPESEVGKENKAKIFFKSYSTATWTFLSSFTSTIPYTCYTTDDTAANNAACMGRRLRRSRKLSLLSLGEEYEAQAHSSMIGDEELLRDDGIGEEARKDKFFFTIWRTLSTTLTITTFSTNRSVTVSVSIMCTYPGLAFNLC